LGKVSSDAEEVESSCYSHLTVKPVPKNTMESKRKPNIPTVLIIFGATGDLMSRKIVPALFNLFIKKKLPRMFKILGVARRQLTHEDFRKLAGDILAKKNIAQSDIDAFLKYFFYEQGQFENAEDYTRIAEVLGRTDGEWKVCANKLFYLAVPPPYYKSIFEHLHESGMTIPCSPEEGWTRVIVEKPFGKDLQTAQDLDMTLGSLFKEEQIYRLDHYLGKEMLQNILAFRFSNNLLEEVWNNNGIEKIEVRILEKLGVENRGDFYDGVGALRDIGQNHILQMLALITMDNPGSIAGDKVRMMRANLLASLHVPTETEVAHTTFRAQHDGYKDVPGVAKNSNTETYFRIKTFIDSPRWEGVPIILEGGKAVNENIKEVVVTFKPPAKMLTDTMGQDIKNKVIFRLEPQEVITIKFWSKEPGLGMNLSEDMFTFSYRKKEQEGKYVEEYERLLLDCIEGNQLLYISTEEIEAMWKFIDPIVEAWNKNVTPLEIYELGSETLSDKAHQVLHARSRNELAKNVGVVGLGKMGGGLAAQLLEKGWNVVGYNRTEEVAREFEKYGMVVASEIKDLVEKLATPRIIILSLPAGKVIDEMLFGEAGLLNYLEKGDIVIDAANSNYKDARIRFDRLREKEIHFVDLGVSGGPGGARSGACLMVGGEKAIYEYLRPMYFDLAVPEGVAHFEGPGAGHFVKMVHNGIEYGMMQAIAEGFAVMKKSPYNLDLKKITNVYNHGSVIESRLIGWLQSGYEAHGEDLSDVTGTVAHTGEGAWTVEAAKELNIEVPIIEGSLEFRKQSEKNPSYTGQILSTLREQFGGHKAKKE
jgi:glucose-6-phosphate 1-dehydrogenase